jgi:GNAT superfamily N-acetyltransferase
VKAEIRRATLADLPALLPMGREFFAHSGLTDLAEWDDGSFEISATSIIGGSVLGSVFVADLDGKLVGMTGGIFFPLYCNHSVLIGQEIFWWGKAGHKVGAALLDELEADARRNGAVIFISAQIAGQRDEAFARVYARRGYRPSENTFIRKLA